MKNSLSATSVVTLVVIILVALILGFTKKTVNPEPRIIANPQPTPIASEPVPFYPSEGKE